MTLVNLIAPVVPATPVMSAKDAMAIALTFVVTMALCAGFLLAVR